VLKVPLYVKLAAGFDTFTWHGPAGLFFSVGGSAIWGVRPQLEGLGFRLTKGTDENPGYWHFYIKADAITSSPELQQSLAPLGVPLEELGIFPGVSQQAPAPPLPQMQPVQQSQQPVQSQWFLSKAVRLEGVPSQSPVVVSRSPNGSWQVMDEGGNRMEVGNDQIQKAVQSVRDDHNKPYASTDPEELFNLINEIEGKPDLVEDTSGRPSPEDVRLPEEWMTVYNKAIEDKFINGVSEDGKPANIMINALAGTGKTTTLKHLSSFIQPGERWLYLVFNKKNQVESAEKFPAGVDVMTTHSFLGKVLRMNGPDVGGKTELPDRDFRGTKVRAVADKMIDPLWPEPTMTSHNRRLGRDFSVFNWKGKSAVTHVVEMAKAYAIDPRSPSLMEELADVVVKSHIDLDLSSERHEQPRDYTPDILQKAADLLQASLPGQLPPGVDRKFANMRDQDDTLWYSAINADMIRWNAGNLGYDVVLMDEVQDFNACQLKMAEMLKQNKARVVGVGDPHQSLYYFRGADETAFEQLGQIISGDDEPMNLPINFRSGSNILDYVAAATGINILAAEHNQGKGVVNTDTKYDDFMAQSTNEYHENGGMMKEATAMICPTNAPLTQAALSLLKNNVEFEIMGKELYRDIEKMIKKVTWQKPQGTDIYDLADALASHNAELQDRWGHKVSKKDELKESQEYTDAILSVMQYLSESDFTDPSRENSRPMRTAMDFLKYLEDKIGGLDPENARDAQIIEDIDPRKVVTLTTAHKSKGLEFERVFVMNPDSFLPKEGMSPSEIKQLQNAFYVSLTRAMKTLYVSADSQ